MTNRAFTLAEILITLLIIGVVASIIIPVLLQDTQDAELKTAWKKAYSELTQVTAKVMMDNGGTLKGFCNNSNCVKNIYSSYLSTVKLCRQGESWGQCWSERDRFWNLDGSVNGWGAFGPSGVVLSNGMFINFWFSSSDCSETWTGLNTCGEITVDVNGFKGPNKIGKDIFLVEIVENGIKAEGSPGDIFINTCSTAAGNSGRGCSAKYLYQ